MMKVNGKGKRTSLKRFCVLLIAFSMLICTPAYSLSTEAGAADDQKQEEQAAVDEIAAEDQTAPEIGDENTGIPEEQKMSDVTLETKAGGVSVRLDADEGTFPDGVSLSAEKVTNSEQKKVDKALESERGDSSGVSASYTFDIRVLDSEGNELQPSEGRTVKLSFTADKVGDDDLTTRVFHIEEDNNKLNATELDVTTDGDTATVETDGFSYYTVEFTYGDKQYVLEGDGAIKLDDLLREIGIRGEVKGTKVSDPELFDVILGTRKGVRYITRFENGKTKKIPANDPYGSVRYVVSYQAFDTEEWMDVTMEDGTTYHVIVTDAITGNDTNHDKIDGVHQGVGHHFAEDIPLATIWIDDRIINASVKSRHVGTHAAEGSVPGWELRFEPGELMDQNNPKYDKGFQIDTSGAGEAPDGSQDKSGAAGYKGNHFIIYDSTEKALNGSVTVDKGSGGTAYQSCNSFEGEIGSYVYENAAVYTGSDGVDRRGDVWITYYDPMITIQTGTDESSATAWNDVKVGLFGSNMLTSGKNKDKRRCHGLDIKVKPTVRDKNGNIVEGSFYFPMVHLNVDRTTSGAPWKGLYQSNPDLENYDESVHNYSEQIKIENGLLENIEKNKVFIPGGSGDIYNYIPDIDEEDGKYTIYPSKGNNDLAHNDEIELPGGKVKAGYTFYFGFLSLVNNGEFSLGYNSSSDRGYSGMESYVLSGTEFNYRLRSSTETKESEDEPHPQPDTGGTIQTTHYGNHSGDLHDGGDIIGPSTIATACGQDVVYTFTPKPGYSLKEVWVWNDKDRTDTFPSGPEGMKTDTNSKRIHAGDGTNDTYESFDDNGDGKPDRYTYAFEDIGSYNAIHVVWEKTLLEVEKTTTGSGKNDPDNFNFTIKITRKDSGSEEWHPVEYVKTGDPSIDDRFEAIAGSDGVYGFSLTNGETLQIPVTWVNAGDKYEIKEVAKENGKYGTTYDWDIVGDAGKSGTLETGKTAHVEFTNKRKKDIDPEMTTLTVKKVWENDDPNLRPKTLTMTIEKEDAIGIDPADFKRAIIDLVGYNATSVRYGTSSAYNAARSKGNVKTIEAEDSWGTGEMYVWKDGTNIYFYSESRIYLVGSASNLFGDVKGNGVNSFHKLKDISGLAHVHTEFVDNMAGMFYDCYSIEDLSPLENWNTANVTNMSKMFAAHFPNNNHMKYTSVKPLRKWKTQNVTNMEWLFRGAKGLTDISPISGWDVGRVTTFRAAFFSTSVGNNKSKALEGWNVMSVSIFSEMFKRSINNGSDTPDGKDLPNWGNNPILKNKRPGKWDEGTYVPDNGPKPNPSDPDKNEKTDVFGNHEKETKSLTAHDVESDGVWIYTFEVPDDGAEWDVYETLGKAYDRNYSVSADYRSKDGTVVSEGNRGVGNKSNPYKGAEPGSTTTITNTGEKHILTVKKDLPEGELDGGAGENTFRFTLKLNSGNKVVRLDPVQEQTLTDAGKLLYSDGVYTLTLVGETAEEFELPAGVKYEVNEIDPISPWKLVSSNHTSGTLDQNREASFTNSHENYFVVRKIWEGDDYNGVIFPTRPTDPKELGIEVTASDGTVYTNPEISFMDDPADYWLYEYKIPEEKTVKSDGVAETKAPDNYEQKVERINEKIFTVTNKLKQYSLRVEKETAGNERGEFDFEIRFWIENSTDKRHPVKIGHSQIVKTENGQVTEGEFVFEDGIEIDGKDVSGVYEYINGELKGQTLHPDGTKPTVDQLRQILSVMQGVNAGDKEAEFLHLHHVMKEGKQLTLGSFDLTWHGQNTELVYVEQPNSVVSNMFSNGRRIDWYIIPDPEQDKVINIRTPYELRETATDDGPAQLPEDLTEISPGTYRFTLKNGGHIQFNHLPAGLSYEVTEYKKEGWDQTSRTDNYNGVLTDDVKVVFGNGSKKGKLIISKDTEYNVPGTFSFRGIFGRPLDESKTSGTKVKAVYPEGSGPVTADVDEAVQHADRMVYTVDGMTYSIEQSGVLIEGTDADVLNVDYPYAFTLRETSGGRTYSMHYEFIPSEDEETGETSYKMDVTSATYEFSLKNGGKATFGNIPFGTAYDVEETDIPDKWELVSLTNDVNGNMRADGHMNVGAVNPVSEAASDTLSYTFTNRRTGKDVTTESKTITRYITYTEYTVYGKKVAETVAQPLKIQRTKTVDYDADSEKTAGLFSIMAADSNSPKITYSKWTVVEGTAGAVASPPHPGWKPDQAIVGEWIFNQDDPQDEWVHVIYLPDGSKKDNRKGSKGGSGTNTGDSTNIALWIGLLAAAGIGFGTVYKRRKRSR